MALSAKDCICQNVLSLRKKLDDSYAEAKSHCDNTYNLIKNWLDSCAKDHRVSTLDISSGLKTFQGSPLSPIQEKVEDRPSEKPVSPSNHTNSNSPSSFHSIPILPSTPRKGLSSSIKKHSIKSPSPISSTHTPTRQSIRDDLFNKFNSMPMNYLVNECRSRGIRTIGSRSELVDALVKYEFDREETKLNNMIKSDEKMKQIQKQEEIRKKLLVKKAELNGVPSISTSSASSSSHVAPSMNHPIATSPILSRVPASPTLNRVPASPALNRVQSSSTVNHDTSSYTHAVSPVFSRVQTVGGLNHVPSSPSTPSINQGIPSTPIGSRVQPALPSNHPPPLPTSPRILSSALPHVPTLNSQSKVSPTGSSPPSSPTISNSILSRMAQFEHKHDPSVVKSPLSSLQPSSGIRPQQPSPQQPLLRRPSPQQSPLRRPSPQQPPLGQQPSPHQSPLGQQPLPHQSPVGHQPSPQQPPVGHQPSPGTRLQQPIPQSPAIPAIPHLPPILTSQPQSPHSPHTVAPPIQQPASPALPPPADADEEEVWWELPLLGHYVKKQMSIDPDLIFSPVTTCDLTEIFPNNHHVNQTTRGSSGNWDDEEAVERTRKSIARFDQDDQDDQDNKTDQSN